MLQYYQGTCEEWHLNQPSHSANAQPATNPVSPSLQLEASAVVLDPITKTLAINKAVVNLPIFFNFITPCQIWIELHWNTNNQNRTLYYVQFHLCTRTFGLRVGYILGSSRVKQKHRQLLDDV